ncbi:MAG: Wzz/FepE/Etk N-terminal domain-containing protein [Steroidobacteraceae bacterium]
MKARRNLPVLAVSATPVAESEFGMGPDMQQQDSNPGMSLQQVVSIVKAYRRHALIIAVVVIVCTAVFAKLLPKTYTATATLMVTADQRDPMAAAQTQQEPIGNYMATEMQLMQSPSVLLAVIDQLKLTQDKRYVAGFGGYGAVREWVKENLVKDLNIEPGQAGSQLIFVNASARDPSLAAQIANTLADTYLSQERERVAGPANERAKRYADELVELNNKVRIAQDQVTAFRQRNNLPNIAAQNSNIDTELLASLETRLQEAQNARRAAEVKAASDQSLNSNATTMASTQPLKTQIDTEQAQLAELRATLGARHPKVLELESQIAANQRNLDRALQTLTSGASAELTAARQLEAKLQAAVTEQKAKVLGVSRLQDEGTKYLLELESAQSVYKRALDGYDQIMFASDSRFSKVNLVSRAVPPQTSSKPKKVKLLMMGALAGIFLGLALPLAYELVINRRVRCRDDFERGFAIPVLMEFDGIPAGSA